MGNQACPRVMPSTSTCHLEWFRTCHGGRYGPSDHTPRSWGLTDTPCLRMRWMDQHPYFSNTTLQNPHPHPLPKPQGNDLKPKNNPMKRYPSKKQRWKLKVFFSFSWGLSIISVWGWWGQFFRPGVVLDWRAGVIKSGYQSTPIQTHQRAPLTGLIKVHSWSHWSF